MTTLCQQLSLVLWKQLVVERVRRSPWISLVEGILPLFLGSAAWLLMAMFLPDSSHVTRDALAAPNRVSPCADVDFRLAFAPSNSVYARELMLLAFPEKIASRHLVPVATEAGLLRQLDARILDVDAAVHFEGMGIGLSTPRDLSYVLHFVSNNSDLLADNWNEPLGCTAHPEAAKSPTQDYTTALLWNMQCRINEAHLQLYAETRNISVVIPKISLKPFPAPMMWSGLGDVCVPWRPPMFTLFLSLGFLPLNLNFIVRFVDEKILDKREWMLILGLHNGAYVWGSVLSLWLADVVPALCMVPVVTMPPKTLLEGAYVYSNPSLLSAIIAVYCAQVALYYIVFGTIFVDRTRVVFGASFFTMLSCAASLIDPLGKTWTSFLLQLLLPDAMLYCAFSRAWEAEENDGGATWSTLWRSDYGLGWCLLSSLLGILFGLFLVWYTDCTWPWPDRMRRKRFQFIFQDEFWCGDDNHEHPGKPKKHHCHPLGEPAVTVHGVRKGRRGLLMDRLCIDFLRNQITVIFGHSGCGKTTLLKMICGIIKPDKGNIYVHDWDVEKNMREARAFISYCAQESTLFDFMTVREHIEFSKLLGHDLIAQEHPPPLDTDELLSDMDLANYAEATIHTLSAGQRRMTCLAVALARQPSVLVLDEPTGCMDAVSRAKVWKILRRQRYKTTVVMTSSKSQEVDILADRVVILAKGVIQECNTVDHIRDKFGVGFRMTLLRDGYTSSELLLDQIEWYAPEYQVLSEIGRELLLYLPNPDREAARALMTHLKTNRRLLELSAVGEPVRTIEDVVIKIWARIREPSYAATRTTDFEENMIFMHKERIRQYFLQTTGRQFYAHAIKKLRLSLRRWELPAITSLATLLMAAALAWVLHVPKTLRSRLDVPSGYQVFLSGAQHGIPEEVVLAFLTKSGMDFAIVNEDPEFFLESLADFQQRDLAFGFQIHTDSLVTVWFSNRLQLAGAAAMNAFHKMQLVNASRVLEAMVDTVLEWPQEAPLKTAFANPMEHVLGLGTGAVCAFAVPALAGLATSYLVVLPAREIRSGLRHVQLMSGMPSIAYWLNTFLWDFLVDYSLRFVACVAPGFCYFFRGYRPDFFVAAFLLLLAYGFAAAPLAYLTTLYVSKRGPLVSLVTINVVYGVAAASLREFLEASALAGDPVPMEAVVASTVISEVLPTPALARGLTKLVRLEAHHALCVARDRSVCDSLAHMSHAPYLRNRFYQLLHCCADESDGNETLPGIMPLSMYPDSIAAEMVALLACGFIAFILLWVSESNVVYKIRRLLSCTRRQDNVRPATCQGGKSVYRNVTPSPPETPGMAPAAENRATRTEVLAVSHLARDYPGPPPVLALKDLSFCVHEGECVAILGQSGAGKTTSVRVLSGGLPPLSGNSWIGSADLGYHRGKYLTLIGYQSTSGALLKDMTGREHLRLVARLRLLPAAQLEATVSHLIRMLGLNDDADVFTRYYCRGSARKLTLAMALVGSPHVVLLDSPTVDVDPITARMMWQVLSAFVIFNKQAVVMATTTMAECEALCSEFVVLNRGTVCCRGPVRSLKNFFKGFVVTITLRDESMLDSPWFDALQREMVSIFEGDAELVTEAKNVVRYKIRDPHIRLDTLEKRLDKVKMCAVVLSTDYGHVALYKLYGMQLE